MKNRFRSSDLAGLGIEKSTSGRGSLLTEGIFAANIDESTPGSLRIALWREWRTMLEDIGAVGPVWSVVRNSHCVLAVQAAYPRIVISADGQWAHGISKDHSIGCHLPSWQRASAFDSACCCGRTYGLEIENLSGELFHRICLAKGVDLSRFAEWTQVHQATGLEAEDASFPGTVPVPLPVSFSKPSPARQRIAPDLMRVLLLTAAQREIPLVATVTAEGMTQSARIETLRTRESQGWLILSGENRAFYVNTEPEGSVLLEREGEAGWNLFLLDEWGRQLLSLRTDIDGPVGG